MVGPLRRGEFFFSVISVRLGTLTVRIGRSCPLLMQADVPDGTACVVLPLEASLLRLNGRIWRPRMVTVYGAGASYMASSHGDAVLCWITLDAADMDTILAPRSARRVQSGGCATMLTDRDAWERAVALVHAVAEVATTDPAIFDVEEACRSLRASILEMLSDLLAGPPSRKPARLLRALHARDEIMRAVDEYIRARAGQAITASELAAAQGMSEAKLGTALRATFGIGLARYLSVRGCSPVPT